MTEAEARTALVAAGRRLLAEGLVARTWGNLSVRLDDKTMVVTPSGIAYPDLTEEMMVVVDIETDAWSGAWKPSGERKVHRAIYRRRPEVRAVVHTHQNAASACAAARLPVPTASGLVECAAYALPGSQALTDHTVEALGNRSAVLLSNHGAFVVGRDLDEAFGAAAALEKDCADHLQARSSAPLPARADSVWKPSWLSPVTLADGTQGLVSAAPFTQHWATRGVALGALLDDLAQLAGPRVKTVPVLPKKAPATGVVLVKSLGALVTGPDAEALAMVVEKAARAALGAEGLGGARPFPQWEAWAMRLVYKNSYSKQATKARRS